MSAVRPTNNTGLIVDEFIRYATQHLNTVTGVISTTSLYPPLGTPGPGIINWTGYVVTPSSLSAEDLQDQIDEEEAAAVLDDINKEYPRNQLAYERQFSSKKDAMENNSNVTPEQAQSEVKSFNEEKSQSNADTKLVGRGDEALFRKCGNGEWPAVGVPGDFKISTTQPGKCTRYWYVVNNDYLKKNCTQIMFPTADGGSKITIHKNLAAIIKPALEQIKSSGLQKYIQNCAGGLAVRNVTCGSRFSNHAWGTAIDMNTTIYPYGYKFREDGIYAGKTKIRELNEFDKGFQQVAAIFKSKGMTWLSNNDPMHVSIYE
jgi:hypothetical protein